MAVRLGARLLADITRMASSNAHSPCNGIHALAGVRVCDVFTKLPHAAGMGKTLPTGAMAAESMASFFAIALSSCTLLICYGNHAKSYVTTALDTF